MHKVRHELLRNVALELLLSDQPRLLRHLLNSDLLIAHFGQHALRSEAAVEVIAEKTARNQGDDHHHADDDQDAAQNDFLERARLLQKSNHALETPE